MMGILIGNTHFRKKSISSSIIYGAIKLLKLSFNITSISLGVNKNNTIARRAFFKAGFKNCNFINKQIIMRLKVNQYIKSFFSSK